MTEKNAWVMANSLFTVLLVCWGNPTVKAVGTVADVVGFLGWGCDERGVLQEEMKCRPCSVYGERKCRSGSYKCLKVITPQMVADKVKELVG